MYYKADSLDDLLFKVYRQILARGSGIAPTKGAARELRGVLLKLASPRLRLSRTESRGILFTCLGEWLWILAGSKSKFFIEYYIPRYDQFSDDGRTIFGAYGPRMFGATPNDQIARVIQLLKSKQDSRQAVVQLFDRTDIIEQHLYVPCTCTLQFLVRDSRLHMMTSMRSNDAWMGLPHDVFAFTMIQELIARSLGVELGDYKHFVGSLHLYDQDKDKATRYLSEGWQPRKPMSPMPQGDPWSAVKALLRIEKAIRTGNSIADPKESMDPYWADLGTLLSIHRAGQIANNQNDIKRLRRRLSDDVYKMYINKRYKLRTNDRAQLPLFNDDADALKEPK